jgi:hypothetical protein
LKSHLITDNKPKKVLQIDLSTNDVISEFESVGIAAKTINVFQTNISECLNGRKKLANGFIWKFDT